MTEVAEALNSIAEALNRLAVCGFAFVFLYWLKGGSR